MKTIIAILSILFINNSLLAQVAVQNNGITYISSSTDTFFVNGSFTNASGAALTNNGRLYVKQDITNNQSSMATGTGTLYLNSSSAQSINGTQVFKTYDLVTNNASGITLNNNLSVSGTHTYTAGMITTSSTPNYMIYESGSSYSGSSDTRHVNGWVKKIGSTNFTFPVGNATYERNIALTNLTASSEFNIRHNGAVTPNYTSLYNPLVIVDTSEYWTINKISGSAAQVTMNWDVSKIPFPVLSLSDIRAAYYDGTFWTSIGGSASGSVLTTGLVTSNSVSAFNTDFVIGSISYVLPLKIINFTAGRMNDYTKINWTIGNELNVDHYELERSDDGINFYTISNHLPFNRNGTEFYSYEDRKILKGTAYYRLKINNLSTQVNYSKTVKISENNTSKDFYVITNPVDDHIDIYASDAVTGIYNYTITNTAGQIMQTGMLDIKYGGTYFIKLKPVFSSGAYLLVVRNTEHILQKIILKK